MHPRSRISMENLLCDEVFKADTPYSFANSSMDGGRIGFCADMAEEAIALFWQKQWRCLPEKGYVEALRSRDLTEIRSSSVRWLIQSRARLNLSFETIFSAVNYLDRCISKFQNCYEWKGWVFELLTVACLSISSKFIDVTSLSLHDIQGNGELGHLFHACTIQKMEILLLKTLDWRLDVVTSHSFIQILSPEIQSLNFYLYPDLITRVTDLLLDCLHDLTLLEYPPSVVAASALWVILQESSLRPEEITAESAFTTSLISGDQMVVLEKCRQLIMNSRLIGSVRLKPSSPVTVLTDGTDQSPFQMKCLEAVMVGLGKKRKREDENEAE